MMTDNPISNECSDPTQSLTVQVPCQLAERIDRYARENDNTVAGVLIEAVDQFLRSQKKS